MKKFALILIFQLSAFSCLTAQRHIKKWIIVKDTENKIVYVDTSSIRKSDGQLSLWSLTKYKKPKEFVMYQGKVSTVKSHILFNTMTNRYTDVGSLLYDKRARIIGESSTPIISGTQRIISFPIIMDSDQQILLDKANEYISTGKVIKEVPQNILEEKPKEVDSTSEIVVKDTVIKPFDDVPVAPILTGDSSVIKNIIGSELRNELIKPGSNSNAVVDTNQVDEKSQINIADSLGNQIGNQLKAELKAEEDSLKSNYISNQFAESPVKDGGQSIYSSIDSSNEVGQNSYSINQEKDTQKTLSGKGTNNSDNASYNSDVEKQIAKNIWGDGNLFVIQLSSWRSKAKALSLVNKLILNGNAAFIFEKYIPQKKRKYYRVRIGYFSSLSAAKTYIKKIK